MEDFLNRSAIERNAKDTLASPRQFPMTEQHFGGTMWKLE